MNVKVRFIGTTPLLLHNARLSDPDDPIATAIREITQKRTKTVEDRAQIADLEWEGSLYTDGDRVVVPGPNLVKTLQEAALPLRLGTQVRRAVAPGEFAVPLSYEGPNDWRKLKTDPAFRSLLSVGSQGSRKAGRTIRSRPRFFPWSIETTLILQEDVLDLADLKRIIDLAGRIEGLGDGRSIGYGRFEPTVTS